MKGNSIEEDMKILEGIIKGDEDCINAIYSQMKVKNDNDEDIQYYKKEIQSIKNIVDNYLKEKARADKLEKEYSAMLTESDENECDYKRVLKENEEWQKAYQEEKDEQFELIQNTNNTIKTANIVIKDLQEKLKEVIPVQKVKDKIEELKQEKKKYGNCLIEMYEDELVNRDIKILQELLEGRK